MSPLPVVEDLKVLEDGVGAQFHVGLAALMIVTSAGTAYRRDDGAQVAPVTTLGPWSNQSGQA